MYLHTAATPPSTSLIETLNDLDNNLIKDTFFKWMLLDRSSCAEDWLFQDQEHENVTALSVFNYVLTIWRK